MSRPTSITAQLVLPPLAAVLLLATPAAADSQKRPGVDREDVVDTTELRRAATAVWAQLSNQFNSSEESLVSTEVAARVLKLTAGVTAPGVPLPDLGSVSLPSLERVPVKKFVLTSRFGHRRDPINGRGKMHSGMDFSAKRGEPVRAAGDGVVIKAERKNGYGRVVYIDHGAGFVTRYAHLHTIEVKEGESVTAGGRIGSVGASGRATGPHLHFEVRVLGEAVDPAPFIGIKTRSFGKRLRDLLTLPSRTYKKPRKRAKTRG